MAHGPKEATATPDMKCEKPFIGELLSSGEAEKVGDPGPEAGHVAGDREQQDPEAVEAARPEKDGQEPDAPKSYLYRIVHNRCIDVLRKGRQETTIDLYHMKEDLPDEETVDRSFIWARLWTAIDRLPAKRREILLLSKRDGLSYAEIARRMGISQNTVHNHMTKTLRTLREGADQVFFKMFLW